LSAQNNTGYPEVELLDKHHGLTESEVKLLKFLAGGNVTSEIAEKLFITGHTLQTHINNLIKKVKLKSLSGLLKYAVQNSLTAQALSVKRIWC
jgi:DNA-binding CsgD family transcriptional regulator